MYAAQDIMTNSNAATAHKLYHLTYYNHLIQWYKRTTDIQELESIYYGAELPKDLATNMSEVLNNAIVL